MLHEKKVSCSWCLHIFRPLNSKSAQVRFCAVVLRLSGAAAPRQRTHRTKRTLKFPVAKSKPWFSALTRPKPTVRTDRDRVSSRPRTNKTAHMVKLEDTGIKVRSGSRPRTSALSVLQLERSHVVWKSMFSDSDPPHTEIRTVCVSLLLRKVFAKICSCGN